MPMNNSAKTDEWIVAVVAANPVRVAPNGQIITCPVRLTFCDLLEPAKPMRGEVADPNKPPKYGCAILFPPGVEGMIQSVIRPAVETVAKTTFPRNFDAATGEFSGLHFPMRRQDEKLESQGFTKGCVFTRVSSKFQPQVVDTAMNPVSDKSRIYNGVWAIVALNPYSFNDPRKKGVSLGLQMVMLFDNDTRLVSQKADPGQTFAGVKIDQAFNPSAAFGTAAPAAGQAAPVSDDAKAFW